jgi:hypothetical protein
MPATDHITWLMDWYLSQCNDDWEHQYGVSIDTLDNPGWSLTVDLNETPLAGRPFTPIYENVAEADALPGLDADVGWMIAKVEDNKFKAFGGPRDLPRLIQAFRVWVAAV